MTEKFIMAGETPLHLCDSESGEKCVVLLHGYLESMLIWDDFVPLLYKQVRVVTIDLPGHGISVVKGDCHTMEYLSECIYLALKELGVERYTLVGHSMGGYVAATFCHLYPEVLDGVVLLSSLPTADSEERRTKREQEIRLIEAGKKEAISAVAPATRFAQENRHRLKPYIDDVRDQILITEDEGILALLRGMMQREDHTATLQQSKVKQLFIFGRKDDDYIPAERAEAAAALHPQAEVAWLENSGHMGFIEEPEECAEVLLNFVV